MRPILFPAFLFLCVPSVLGQKTFDVKSFGPVGRNVDGSATLRLALASVRQGALVISAGEVVNAVGTYEVPSGVTVQGTGTLVGTTLEIASHVTIQFLSFEGARAGIVVDPSVPRVGDVIKGNRFVGVTRAVWIPAAISGGTATYAELSHNVCDACRNFVFAERVSDSTFADNTVNVDGRGFLFFGGSNNLIVDNTVAGGITGISFVYHFGINGTDGFVANNIVEGNHLTGVREESISFDVRGNEPKNMAVREVDTVIGRDGSVVTLSAPGWRAESQHLHQLYFCWLSGNLEGTCLHSVGGNGNSFDLDASKEELAAVQVGDRIVLGAPFLGNGVYRNEIQVDPAAKFASGILLWGYAYGNAVCGNRIFSAALEPGTMGIGVMSLNGLDSGGAITMPKGGRKSPSENNLVARNRVTNLNLRVGYFDWANQLHYTSVGNTLFANRVVGGRIETSDQGASSRNNRSFLAAALEKTLRMTHGEAICGVPAALLEAR